MTECVLAAVCLCFVICTSGLLFVGTWFTFRTVTKAVKEFSNE